LIIKCIASPARQQDTSYNPSRGNQGKPPTDNPSRGNQGKPPTDNSMVAQTDSYGGNPSREAMRRKGGDN
jgi:hypothetical protein